MEERIEKLEEEVQRISGELMCLQVFSQAQNDVLTQWIVAACPMLGLDQLDQDARLTEAVRLHVDQRLQALEDTDPELATVLSHAIQKMKVFPQYHPKE